ncbi:MAG: tetratricopeptide repeat protein [Pyrinomonadaceae bacterium]|nr:tetratricopeptide repeat protein [Pyrinomonadaceae bacterium]
MFKRTVLWGAIAVAMLAIGAAPAIAQTGPISGTVVVERDGKSTPAEGVVVEAYRTDVNGAGPKTKTDKSGRFAFAGVQAGATMVLVFSGPGLAPTYAPAIKAGSENLKIAMTPGDGRQLTEEEARILANRGNRELTEEEKKKAAEDEAKIKAIEEKNKKIVETTAVIQKALQEGNAAYEQKNYDLAVTKYEEGIAADPDFVGSAPVLLNNKGTALRVRAVNNYNANVKKPAEERAPAMAQVRKDFADALESFSKSYDLLKGAQPGSIPDANRTAQTTTAIEGANATLKLVAQTEQAEGLNVELAQKMIDAYAETQSDAAKKAASKVVLGDVYRVSGEFEKAVTVYKEVLAGDPANVDAMVGAGLSLFNVGYANSSDAQLQEGADLLQRYTEAAPAGHKFLDDAKAVLDNLKAEKNIAPQKSTRPAARRRN